MFQSRRLSQKIRGQSKKNVVGGSQTPPAKMTTIQKLYRALAYVQLRSVSEFLTFTDEEYKAMETGLIDAIRQLQRRETLDDLLQPFGKWSDKKGGNQEDKNGQGRPTQRNRINQKFSHFKFQLNRSRSQKN